MRLYVDGELKGELYNPYSDFSGIYFSHYTGTTNYTGFFGSSYFAGNISDIQIFAKVLSQEEIVSMFNEGVKICASGQCRAAEFIEMDGRTVINFFPKGVVYCRTIQEDPSIETPQLLPNGVLKVKEIVEE
jgi:hypothetical protein